MFSMFTFQIVLCVAGVLVTLALVGVSILFSLRSSPQDTSSTPTNDVPNNEDDAAPQNETQKSKPDWTPKIWNEPRPSTPFTFETIDVDGTNRNYWLHRPTKQPTTKVPVILYFHGTSPNTVLASSAFDNVKEQCVIVQPIGTSNADGAASWNTGSDNPSCGAQTDDLAFVRTLMQTIQTWKEVDLGQVVICGFSVGAAFVSYMSYQKEFQSLFRGFGSMSSPVQETNLDAISRASPSIIWNSVGKTDAIVPWQGGESPTIPDCATFASWKNVAATWAQVMGLTLESNKTETVTSLSGHSKSHAFIGYLFESTGHSMHSDAIDEFLGDTYSSLALMCASFLLGSRV